MNLPEDTVHYVAVKEADLENGDPDLMKAMMSQLQEAAMRPYGYLTERHGEYIVTRSVPAGTEGASDMPSHSWLLFFMKKKKDA